jgi:hypothetical protein
VPWACPLWHRDGGGVHRRRGLAQRWRLAVHIGYLCQEAGATVAVTFRATHRRAPRPTALEGAVAAVSISRSGRGCPEHRLTHGNGPPMPTAQHAPPPPPRRFLCVRCRSAVLICSHCDRGQRYCSAACSLQARSCAQRAAAKRYQDSRRGRHAHARRQGQWRARQQIVTHQGSPPPPRADVLPPGDTTAVNPDANQRCKCHFCGRWISDFVRQNFLRGRFRHPSKATLWSTDSHGHFT